MCNLKERLENYVRSNNIDLTYDWKGQNENQVDICFFEWHQRMTNANSEEEFREIIADIFRWGGVGSDRLKQHYAEKLHRHDTSFESVKNTPLASWTKILAAYDPERYWIYDSRVAIALKTLVHEYDWFIPRRRNDEVGAYFRCQYTNALTATESYDRYLILLSAVDVRASSSLEKKLFMLGGQITINV